MMKETILSISRIDSKSIANGWNDVACANERRWPPSTWRKAQICCLHWAHSTSLMGRVRFGISRKIHSLLRNYLILFNFRTGTPHDSRETL